MLLKAKKDNENWKKKTAWAKKKKKEVIKAMTFAREDDFLSRSDSTILFYITKFPMKIVLEYMCNHTWKKLVGKRFHLNFVHLYIFFS